MDLDGEGGLRVAGSYPERINVKDGVMVVDPLVFKAASSVAGPAMTKVIKLATFRKKVAIAVRKQAKSLGIEVTSKAISTWLERPDVHQMFRNATPAAVDSAVLSLAVPLPSSVTAEQREQLLGVICHEVLRELDPGAATATAFTMTSRQIASEGERTRGKLDEVLAVSADTHAIVTAFSPPALLEENLRRIHPWRAQEARELLQQLPAAISLIRDVVSSPKVEQLVADWWKHPPVTLQGAPARFYVWLAELASGYGLNGAAAHFFELAVDLGVSPRNYYLARQALSLAPVDEVRSRSVELEPAEPLSVAVIALRVDDFATAAASLDAWEPAQAPDRAFRSSLLGQSLRALGRLDDAIAELTRVAGEQPDASGVATLAAEYLIERAGSGVTISPPADLASAYRWAIQARDSRRVWSGDCSKAVLLAVQAAVQGGDQAGALRLVSPEPSGEASEQEARNPALRAERAILLALAGKSRLAHEVAASMNDPFVAAFIEGLAADDQGDRAGATRALLRAYDLASSDNARARVASALVWAGDELPDLEDLATRQPDAVRVIRRTHEALAPGPDRLVRLRARAHEEPAIAASLARAYEQQGDPLEAARTFEKAGNEFRLPSMLISAAQLYLSNGEAGQSITQAEAALAMAPQGWGGEFPARVVLYEAMWADNRLPESVQQARRLVELQPANPSAVWALTVALLRLDEEDQAWRALAAHGTPIDPRTPFEARVWIRLVVRSPQAATLVARALGLMQRWDDDAELTAYFLTNLIVGTRDGALDPADVEAIREAQTAFTARHPKSDAFQLVQAGPDGDPLKHIRPLLKDRYEALHDLHQQIAEGRLPVGAATIVSSTYTSLLIEQTGGRVYAYRDQDAHQRGEAAAVALSGRCVIDTTAVATLARLDEAVSDDLRGRFTELVSTLEAYRDARATQDEFNLGTAGSIHWDPDAQDVRATKSSADKIERDRTLAARIVGLIGSFTRVPRVELVQFPEFEDRPSSLAWLAGLDLAAELGIPFWCDDMQGSELARSVGVQTFGTVDLLRHLSASDSLDLQLANAAEATLINHRYVDLGFQRETMFLAAELSGWRPSGAAVTLTRSRTWVDPEPVADFLEHAMTAAAVIGPEALYGWVASAAIGLTADLPANQGSANLAVLLRRAFGVIGVRADQMPAVLQGVREPLAANSDLVDPLEQVLRDIHRDVAEAHGHQVAQMLVFALLTSANDDDKRTAARVVLTDR